MEEKFEIAFEEAIKNGENEELIKRDKEEIQNAINEQQKIYIEWQRISSDVRRIFNASSEEVREYANNIQNLFDRLKIINDIIDKNAKAYRVTIEKGELPFDEEALERPLEETNYFSAQPKTITPKIPEAGQTQPSAPESQEGEQLQPKAPEKPEDRQPQTQALEVEHPQSQRQEEQPEPPTMENAEGENKDTLEKSEIIENENQMKITKKDLELAKIANDFYCGKIEGHKLSKEDRLFFANNTLEDIKKKYGENVFPESIEDEKLFDEFIKYQSLKDGLYMTKEDRELMMKNRDAIFYNQEIVDPESKKLYDRFFKDCNGDEYQIALRYTSLSTMGGRIDDIYKKIEEKFKVNDLNKPDKPEPIKPDPTELDPIRPEPIAPNTPVGSATVTPNVPVGPTPVAPNTSVGQQPIGPAPAVPNPVQANVNQTKILNNKPLLVNVKVLGKKMLVNGKEYEYNTKYGENINQEISEIFSNVHNSPMLIKFISQEIKDDLIQMSGTLKDKYHDAKILDPNIVYAIVQACKDMINITGTDAEREKSIEIANEYFKKLMYQYMRYASGNFVKGLRFNDLVIEYNLKEAMKLDEEDRKAIEDWAVISKDYAKIVDISFLQKIINKIKSIFSKKNKPLLGEGKSDDKNKQGQPQDKDGAKQPEAGQVQPAIPEQDTPFVQKLPIEPQNQQAPTQASPEPSRHINLPNRNDEHGNMEP